jgi:hypothetical protein
MAIGRLCEAAGSPPARIRRSSQTRSRVEGLAPEVRINRSWVAYGAGPLQGWEPWMRIAPVALALGSLFSELSTMRTRLDCRVTRFTTRPLLATTAWSLPQVDGGRVGMIRAIQRARRSSADDQTADSGA